ncbi:MAG: ABC transporter ATP-binding protein, partial [Spirochaetales bacterium]|nr:ABC transporter ATP-binding protein [Spirochaetales bacterium]
MEIRLDKLRKEFASVAAVDDLDITIPEGSLVGLLGPSGCGKSTTLFMIAGLYKPTAGRIFFGKEDITTISPEKRGIGLVFQNYALYPHMTALQNITFPLENLKVPKKEARERAQEMADLVQIGDLLDRKPSQLSGGQQQRVAIARALVKKPRVLLLDEPLSNLDARLRLETRKEIRRLQRETGITTIYVTHDQEEAMSITDEIVLMNRGVLQQKDSPQEMYRRPANRFVAEFLGNPPINILKGEVKNSRVYIQGTPIGEAPGVPDRSVDIGIRPENWGPAEEGLKATATFIERIGKDTIINVDLGGRPARAITGSDADLTT